MLNKSSVTKLHVALVNKMHRVEASTFHWGICFTMAGNVYEKKLSYRNLTLLYYKNMFIFRNFLYYTRIILHLDTAIVISCGYKVVRYDLHAVNRGTKNHRLK